MKTLGLIGGTSWHSTVEYYRSINQAVNDAHGNNTNPYLILHSLDQHAIHRLQMANDWDGIAQLLVDAAIKLQAAGAEGIVFCANTPHKVHPEVSRAVNIPILHIADAIGNAVQKAGLNRVGLIGTVYAMEERFIQDRLSDQYGIDTLVPLSAVDRQQLQRIIQDELALGIFKPESRHYILAQIQDLQARGGQGIILGCTEFPLIVSEVDTGLPTFDTLQLHASMAVDFILGR